MIIIIKRQENFKRTLYSEKDMDSFNAEYC